MTAAELNVFLERAKNYFSHDDIQLDVLPEAYGLTDLLTLIQAALSDDTSSRPSLRDVVQVGTSVPCTCRWAPRHVV